LVIGHWCQHDALSAVASLIPPQARTCTLHHVTRDPPVTLEGDSIKSIRSLLPLDLSYAVTLCLLAPRFAALCVIALCLTTLCLGALCLSALCLTALCLTALCLNALCLNTLCLTALCPFPGPPPRPIVIDYPRWCCSHVPGAPATFLSLRHPLQPLYQFLEDSGQIAIVSDRSNMSLGSFCRSQLDCTARFEASGTGAGVTVMPAGALSAAAAAF